MFWGIIWFISYLLNKDKSGSSKSNWNSYSKNYKKRNYRYSYNYAGDQTNQTGSYYFHHRTKPLIVISIHILNKCNIPIYLRKGILEEMFGKNVKYRSEILEFIEKNYYKSYGFVSHYAETVKQSYSLNNRKKFIRNQIRMLNNARRINQNNINAVYSVAARLGINTYWFQNMLNEFNLNYSFEHDSGSGSDYRYQNYKKWPGGKDPYQVLGIPRGTPLEKVKDRYIRLVAKYHPDRYLNRPEKERKQAEEIMKEINIAYDQIKKDLAGQNQHTGWY